MNEITLSIIGLFIVAGVIIAILARKDNKIRKLENENKNLESSIDYLKEGIDLSAKIIGISNVLNVPPKDLPEDFDK